MTSAAVPDTRILQVCVIVDDLDHAAAQYRALLGVDVPTDVQVTHAHDHTRATYHGQPMDARARIVSVMLGDVAFELLQPLDEGSVWMDHLRAHGPSVHHIAFHVPRSAPAAAHFQDHGYAVTQRGLFTGRTGMYTYLDTDARLGVTVELLEHYHGGNPPASPPFPPDRGLGSDELMQVGVVVADVHAAVRAYREVLGLPEPAWVEIRPDDDPHATYRGRPLTADAQLAIFQLGQVQLEVFQPGARDSAWRQFLDDHGPGAHHIAFRVPDTARVTDHLARHGTEVLQQGSSSDGRWRYTYYPTERDLGVVLEVLEARRPA
ncbi:VOC family protein [uncultured Deinococcus sp.]|uniref:VOC family protein n=1 Tax=uncultured Deinococcus sp. TaxID=158789 RepID=UPI0025F2BA6A|nr:VOC family protein [uncultured Deinococcus sp.]